MTSDRPGSHPGNDEEQFEVPLGAAAARSGISSATLYKRVQAGTLPAHQEVGGRRRWMLRPSDVAALSESGPQGTGGVGEWPHELVGLLAAQARQLEAAHGELRELERRAVRLETENSELRGKDRDLQSVLRALSAAMGESVQALALPDTPND